MGQMQNRNLKQTIQRQIKGMKLLYGSGSTKRSDQPFASAYDARISQAGQRGNRMEVERLKQEQAEFRQFADELQLDDPSALRMGSVLKQTAYQPLSRKELTKYDQERFTERFGPQAGEIAHAAATHVNKLLSTKPALLDAVNRGGAWIHADFVETAAEAYQALAAKPTET